MYWGAHFETSVLLVRDAKRVAQLLSLALLHLGVCSLP